jgi:hypothetical protein
VTTKVWSELAAQSGYFVFAPGQRYAVLASVSLNYSLAQIEAKATSEGFQVTYAWETGQPSRATYRIDDWLDSLPDDTTSNHRWVYAEGNFLGVTPWSLPVDPPWPFTIYHVAHVFQAVDAPDQPANEGPASPALPPASSTTSAPTSSSWVPVALEIAAAAALSLGIAYAVGVPIPWWPRRA